jgi:hypothetical protein
MSDKLQVCRLNSDKLKHVGHQTAPFILRRRLTICSINQFGVEAARRDADALRAIQIRRVDLVLSFDQVALRTLFLANRQQLDTVSKSACRR